MISYFTGAVRFSADTADWKAKAAKTNYIGVWPTVMKQVPGEQMTILNQHQHTVGRSAAGKTVLLSYKGIFDVSALRFLNQL